MSEFRGRSIVWRDIDAYRAWIGTTWRATRIIGTFRVAAPQTVFGLTHCRAGSVTNSSRGTLQQ